MEVNFSPIQLYQFHTSIALGAHDEIDVGK